MKKSDTKTIAPLRPIRTAEDNEAALALVAPYFDNEPEIKTDAGMTFEAMVTLIEAYEAKHYRSTHLTRLKPSCFAWSSKA